MISRLANSAYPEYMRVFHLMAGRRKEPNYRRLTAAQVTELKESEIVIETSHGTQWVSEQRAN